MSVILVAYSYVIRSAFAGLLKCTKQRSYSHEILLIFFAVLAIYIINYGAMYYMAPFYHISPNTTDLFENFYAYGDLAKDYKWDATISEFIF